MINTTVSANGHVVKTVKGNIIGVVTIVDDQADVELERSKHFCEITRNKASLKFNVIV